MGGRRMVSSSGNFSSKTHERYVGGPKDSVCHSTADAKPRAKLWELAGCTWNGALLHCDSLANKDKV